jgi:pimeloyl-ACP methyl ester carboxylesterase
LRGRGPTLLFLHATGFHGRVWDHVIAGLPGHHVIALEQRGHGRSETTEIHGWQVFGQDAAAFVRALGLGGLVGIGHSMGGHALVQAAAIDPDAFRRLIVIDPVIVSPAAYHLPHPFKGNHHPAAQRMNRFASPQAMIERFAGRPPYTVFDPRVLRDYCEWGLVPADDGDGCVLACEPVTEASIYLTARGNGGVYASVRALQIPVLILRAKLPPADRSPLDFSSSPTWPPLVDEFRNAREIHFPDRTHLLPMEMPDGLAALIGEELAKDA